MRGKNREPRVSNSVKSRKRTVLFIE